MQLHHLDPNLIEVPPERQRSDVGDLDELAESIRSIGQINPITITHNHELIAGERRLRACQQANLQVLVRYYEDLAAVDRMILEWDENARRQDLPWKETADALLSIHEHLEASAERWTITDTARRAAIPQSKASRIIQVARELRKGNKRVHEAANLHSAYNVVTRDQTRAVENEMALLTGNLGVEEETEDDEHHEPSAQPSNPAGGGDQGQNASPAASAAGQSKPRVRRADRDITVANFLDWAPSYTGRKFNFLHCDFPYGISHQSSAQGGSGRWGAYDDSPDVYWRLCACLAENLDRILLPSAHIMFWFSMNYYTETLDFFAKAAPSLEFVQLPLIWHKTDNRGIVSDVQRRPRHVYETAIVGARGDRKIIQPVADVYGAPTGKSEARHLSEKPEPVLKHFMRMYVDNMTEMFDPTCGSGSALRAAEALGAKRVFGLELDGETAQAAQSELQSFRTLRAAETYT